MEIVMKACTQRRVCAEGPEALPRRQLGESSPLASAGVGDPRFGTVDTLDQVTVVRACPVLCQMFSGMSNFDHRDASSSLLLQVRMMKTLSRDRQESLGE